MRSRARASGPPRLLLSGPVPGKRYRPDAYTREFYCEQVGRALDRLIAHGEDGGDVAAAVDGCGPVPLGDGAPDADDGRAPMRRRRPPGAGALCPAPPAEGDLERESPPSSRGGRRTSRSWTSRPRRFRRNRRGERGDPTHDASRTCPPSTGSGCGATTCSTSRTTTGASARSPITSRASRGCASSPTRAARSSASSLGAESYEILEDTGHLEWVAVAPEHRRDGLATP